MRWRIPLVVALALFVAVSCDQQPVEPQPDQVSEATFDWTNNPDNGNPRILRGETDWIICWSDAELTDGESNGLRGCMSTLPLGGGSEPDCGLQEEIDRIEWQDVGIWDPDDMAGSWIHEVVKGEVWITVRDENTPGDCFGDALVAEGYGNFHLTDNDFNGSGNGGNVNAWKFMSQGNKLLAPDGSYVNYNAQLQLRYNNNKDYFYVVSSKVDAH